MPETLERKGARSLEWRRQKAATLAKTVEHRAFDLDASGLEIREAEDGTLTLTGYASVYERSYEMGWFTERVARGAGRRTLSENPDVQLLVNHTGLPLARTVSGTLRLTEDERGLHVEADLDPEDPDVKSLVRKMRRGDIDQMSFAFRVTDDSWNEDLTERVIRSYSIHRGDVSVVNMGANEAASATVRSQAVDALAARSRADVLGALLEIRVGKKLSAATTEILTQVLSLTGDAETAAGEARDLLDELVNPPESDAEAGDSVERSIETEKDLCAAIRAVLREPDQDERRAAIIRRAGELDRPGLVPDGWAADGAIPEGRALVGEEQRETYNDTLAALDSALNEKLVENGDCWYVWVQDFTDAQVIYYAQGKLWAAPYTLTPGGPVTIGDGEEVRPVTEYVPMESAAEEAAEAETPVERSQPLPDFTTRARQDLDLILAREARR